MATVKQEFSISFG